MTTELQAISNTSQLSVFSNAETFADAQRMANLLCSSGIVPKDFQGEQNLPNCVIALEMAQRLGASPLAVMQSIYMVHGKPGWSATYIIAMINTSGKFSPLRFDITGTGDNKQCVAWVTDKTGERLESPPVSIGMAKSEGWYGRTGSKWQTMPELMLRYRAATFFGRLYAPDLMMGMQTAEEIIDVIDVTPGASGSFEVAADTTSAGDLNSALKGAQASQGADVVQTASVNADVITEPADDDAGPPDAGQILHMIETAKTDDDLDVAESFIASIKGAKSKSSVKSALLNRRAELQEPAKK